jgi:hypothetical protein
MKIIKGGFFLGSILSFALMSVGNAQSAIPSVGDGDHYTKSQLKKMAQEAHTPDQYRDLATYYWDQQNNYHQRAKAVHHEWVSQWQTTPYHPAKYPTPADAARNLYNDYVSKAAEAGALAAKYGQMAESVSPAAQQM